MTKTDTAAMKQALLDLFNTDEVIVMKALKKLKREGEARHINALMELYVSRSQGPVRQEVESMLSAMKLPGGDDALVDLLREERFKDHHAFVLTCIWNSGYIPVEHLDVIVAVGMKGDFMTCFEVLTVVEALVPPFDPDALVVASINVDEYLDERHNHERDPLVEQIKTLLDQMKAAAMDPADTEAES
jgi:hypothetical protein